MASDIVFDKDNNDIRLPTLEMDPAALYRGANVVTGADYIDMNPPWLDANGNPIPQKDQKEPPDVKPGQYYDKVSVSTSGIRAAENSILAEGYTQLTQFQTFKKQVIQDEDWVFLVSNKHDMEVYWHDEKLPPNTKSGWMQGGQKAGNYADFVDPDPTKTRETIAGQHALLRAVGDSIESMGHFAAMLNDAAQLYAYTDEQVTVPNYSTVPMP